MLIEICEDIVELAEKNDADVLDALRYVGMAHRLGKHFAFADFRLMGRICKIQSFSERERGIFSQIRKNLASYGNFAKNLQTKLILTTSPNPGKASCIYINPKERKEFELYEETHVLTENLSDVEFYKYLVDYYKRKNKLTKVPIVMFPMMGGGDTIAKVYDEEITLQQHLCVAILDSDKKRKGGKIGDTAGHVRKIHKKKLPFNCNYYIMEETREVENLIPETMIRNCSKYKDNALFTQYKSFDLSYYDMKNGFYVRKMLLDKESLEYWKRTFIGNPAIQNIIDDCYNNCIKYYKGTNMTDYCKDVCNKHPLMPGFSTSLLEDILETQASSLQHVDDADLSPSQQKEWYEIGKTIFEWCCSASPSRV